LSPQQVADAQAGLFYINIHSDACPNGELRAQLDLALPDGFALAELAAPLPIFGSVDQTVDPDNFNNPCEFPSRAQIRGTYFVDATSGIFNFNVTFGSNAPSFDDNKLLKGGPATLLHFHGPGPRGEAASADIRKCGPDSGSR
jgi:hypothetical protein